MIKIVIVWATGTVITITFYPDTLSPIPPLKPKLNWVNTTNDQRWFIILFILVGVGYDEQICEDALPFEDHDIQLHEIITPNNRFCIQN